MVVVSERILLRRPFLVAAVLSVAAVYFSVYASAYIVIIVGILVAAGFLIYLKHTGIPIFYVLFIMMFPVMYRALFVETTHIQFR